MKGKTMKKVYLKDLQLDEVIRRLKSGEILKNEQSKSQIKYIDGVLCRICENGTIEYNTNFWTCNIAHYFEEPEELKLEVGKPYKTKSGEKAFITDFNKYTRKYRGVIVGINEEFFSWQVQGILDGTDHAYDIVAEWGDDDVAKD